MMGVSGKLVVDLDMLSTVLNQIPAQNMTRSQLHSEVEESQRKVLLVRDIILLNHVCSQQNLGIGKKKKVAKRLF